MRDKILDTLAECTKKRIEKNKQELPFEELKKKALAMNCNTGFPFEQALKKRVCHLFAKLRRHHLLKG